jgi:hypothetical protein
MSVLTYAERALRQQAGREYRFRAFGAVARGGDASPDRGVFRRLRAVNNAAEGTALAELARCKGVFVWCRPNCVSVRVNWRVSMR